MNFFLKRFSIRFNLSLEGSLLPTDESEKLSFKVDLCARGAEDPEEGLFITGLINIQGFAKDRPLIGAMTGGEGGFDVSFRFSDEDLHGQRFEGKIKGSILRGSAILEEGYFFRADEDEPWAGVESARIESSMSSFRVERRPRRPVFKERKKPERRREPRPLPMRRTAVKLAEAIFPAGEVLDAGGEDTIKRLENSDLGKGDRARMFFGAALFGIEWLSWLGTGKRFSRASLEERVRWLERPLKSASGLRRVLLRLGLIPFVPFRLALLSALKVFHINTDDAHSRLSTIKRRAAGLPRFMVGEDGPAQGDIAPDPVESWEKQIKPASGFDADEVIEADAVVIGTGAGGGPAARVLAERGFAVAVIEAGRLYKREHSRDGAQEMLASLGNTFVLLPVGKAVGGTTFINSGTCFRTPPEILMKWVDQGMPDFHPDRMAPYFDSVEDIIKVAEAESKYVGPVGEVIRCGADKLGYHSMNLRRNAFECEGKALCTQGCPHGAKQSTDRSYIPLALKSKATLFTGFKAREILTSGERAIGVHAYGRGKNGRTVRLTVFAKAVILSAGTFLTPPLIQRNGLVRGNSWIGKNLSFHPATGAAAIVPGVEMRTHECIPQGYCVDEFREEGIMFEGANIPLIGWAVMQQGVGEKYIKMLEKFPNMANFGYMVEETSRGRVRPGPGGRPFITYWMNDADLKKLVKGMATLARIFLAAGAENVFCATLNMFTVTSEDDVRRLESHRWRPRSFLLSAYHPLGTARVGPDEKVSVIDMNHECHAVPGLFVVDGSAVPESIGVNPQVTIMAMATRAGERIAALLEKR